MAGDNVAIRVQGVYKNFLLPHEKNTTIKSAFLGLARKRKTVSSETQHALKDISFEVKKGEFFGIVGRNGSGKSTLLKMLAGIYEPTKGKIEVGGKLVPFIELGVGFNPELTGRDNVYLNGSLLGFSTTEIDGMYDEIVQFAELEKFMDQKLKNYSSGMQVRLAFSMAVKAEAEILLVDEVLAVGDADFQRKCFEYFKLLKKNKKTVIFVSHDMSAVREYCDRVILIEKSELILEGQPNKVATAYTKMFTPDDDSKSETQKRWGNGKMTQTSAKIIPKVIENNTDVIKVNVTFESKVPVEDPVLGIIIKNSIGEQITGINTKIKNIHTGKFSAGDKSEIEWSFPNIFNDGQYSLDLAISDNDTITQYDWWEDAIKFKVYKEERTPFVVSPGIQAKITSSSKVRK